MKNALFLVIFSLKYWRSCWMHDWSFAIRSWTTVERDFQGCQSELPSKVEINLVEGSSKHHRWCPNARSTVVEWDWSSHYLQLLAADRQDAARKGTSRETLVEVPAKKPIFSPEKDLFYISWKSYSLSKT
ncbi:hypothetical protein KPH14_009643 [Odynerus spinipes]|uniref:Uncharacterized protein n=1 Tax=Odynerus spinipes TaxID=1348599 RepID=A0AAD9RPZ1_9HYME|nr:hypothetical protein KPH14_009643 [Odynerus spinipes]